MISYYYIILVMIMIILIRCYKLTIIHRFWIESVEYATTNLSIIYLPSILFVILANDAEKNTIIIITLLDCLYRSIAEEDRLEKWEICV